MASKEHQELANIIKKLHVDLRLKARETGADEAWNQHVKCTEQLQIYLMQLLPELDKVIFLYEDNNYAEVYATAMLKLATEHWDKNNMNKSSLCRIQWVVDKCSDYFNNGGLEMAIEKESRLSLKYFGTDLSSTSDFKKLIPFQKDNLYLLDVGSCYNPFKHFNNFYTVAIDLVPATEDVLKCDFLNVELVSDKTISDIANPCVFIPENSFDIVLFSLLLEYFPSAKQRWICCKKAYNVLKPNGVLVILTPDSKHASANSKMIKYWRYALADIGFLLIYYEKLKHLHCLMYRKCINNNVPKHWLSLQNRSDSISVNAEEIMYIPQDFHDYERKLDDGEVKKIRTDCDNKFITDAFIELPETDPDLFI